MNTPLHMACSCNNRTQQRSRFDGDAEFRRRILSAYRPGVPCRQTELLLLIWKNYGCTRDCPRFGAEHY